MGAAYSNCGRIKVLYAAAFVSLGAKVKLCRRNPRVLVAFKVISEISKFVFSSTNYSIAPDKRDYIQIIIFLSLHMLTRR